MKSPKYNLEHTQNANDIRYSASGVAGDSDGPLAAAHVPLLNIHGYDDDKVAYALNSEKLTNNYKALAGQADLVTLHGAKHGHVRHDPLFFESTEMLRFLVKYASGNR